MFLAWLQVAAQVAAVVGACCAVVRLALDLRRRRVLNQKKKARCERKS
jgi:hypothetical protein